MSERLTATEYSAACAKVVQLCLDSGDGEALLAVKGMMDTVQEASGLALKYNAEIKALRELERAVREMYRGACGHYEDEVPMFAALDKLDAMRKEVSDADDV